MTVGADRFLDWCENRRHILSEQALLKHYLEPNSGAGLTLHSAVGFRPGNEAEMNKPIAERKFSMMGDIMQNGVSAEYYTVDTSTWISSGRVANTTTWGWEFDGGVAVADGGNGKDEPLTPEQMDRGKMLIVDWEQDTGHRASRIATPDYPKTMHEHREWNPGTECPSGRFNPLWDWVEARKVVAEPLELRVARLEVQMQRANEQRAAYNLAMVQRFDIIELAAGPIDGIRSAYPVLLAGGHIKPGDDA